jgi:solute carrier family 35, member C2
MLGWFVSSALLSSYNKIVFGAGHQAFPCPLLLTSVHFLSQWIFSYVVSTLYPVAVGTDRLKSHNMTWKEWFSISVPCGLVTSGDVGLSNLSLVTISMTFYTMVKSSAPIFVLMWAYLFGIERITMNLIFVVIIICIGEVLTVTGEVDFHLGGFLLCLSASVLSGARWTLVQLKIRSMDPPLKTTIATMRLLAPSMFWSMLLVSFAVEQPWERLKDRSINQTLYDLFGIGLLGATFAIFMILCEFWLIMRTNAFVLMIGGVLKEMITIFVGVSVFGDELNRVNISGCFVVFVGVIYYKFTHNRDAKEHAKREALAATNADSLSDTGTASTSNIINGYQRSRLDDTDEDGSPNMDFNDRITLRNTNSHDEDKVDTLLHDNSPSNGVLGDKGSTASRTTTLRSRSGGLTSFFSFGANNTSVYTKVITDSSERDGGGGGGDDNIATTSGRIMNNKIINRRSNTNNTPTATTVSRGLETGESTCESASSDVHRSHGVGNTGQSSSVTNDMC